MFTILNWALVGGLAAMAAPIIIHIIHRRQIKWVHWGAMRFLLEMLRQSRSRLFIEQWLLLLIRMAILLCVGLTLMRPALKPKSIEAGGKGIVRHGHVAAVILIDDSASTGAGRGRILLESMRELTLAYINTLEEGDEVSVLRLSQLHLAQSDPLFDLDAARDLVRAIEPTGVKSDIPRLLEAGLVQLTRHLNPAAELVLVTDGGSEGWQPEARARWAELHAQLRREAGDTALRRPRLIHLQAQRPTVFENTAIIDLGVDRTLVPIRRALGVHVVLQHTGEHVPRGMRLRLNVDDRTVEDRPLDLEPGARRRVAFRYVFDEPGSHVIQAVVAGAHDAFKGDDSRALALDVRQRIPVLVVEERPATGLGGSLGFAALALDPYEQNTGLFAPYRIAANALAHTRIEDYRAVVLGPVPALDAAAVAAVERYVAAGGGLLVCLGDATDPSLVNRFWARSGDGFLPCPLAELRVPRPALPPVVDSSAHPALSAFAGDAGDVWEALKVKRYFGLDRRPVDPGELTVLVKLSNGEPLVVERRRGLGRVVLVATSLDLAWSNLPVQAAYVPLVRGLVGHLASEVQPPRNLQPGQRLSFLARSGTPQVDDARGKPVVVKKGAWEGQQAYLSAPLTATGIYRVQDPEADRPVYYAVTLDSTESLLTPLSDTEQEQICSGMHPLVLRDVRSVGDVLDPAHRKPVELWHWFLMVAILLLFGESLATRLQVKEEHGRSASGE